MLWVDEPNWSDETRRILIGALANAFRTGPVIEDVATSVGLEPADIPLGNTPREVWFTLAQVAYQKTVLRRLVEEASRRLPASNELRQVLAATVAGTVSRYRAVDPYEACLFGGGHRSALIDRSELRTELKRMINEERPVLSVLGPTQTGKSYSLGLITHIAEQLGYKVVALQIERQFSGDVTAKSLITVLGQRLGLRLDLSGIDTNTTGTNIATQLANVLTGSYPSDGVRRLIVIDGLDREVVKDEVRDLVKSIADEIVLGQLNRTQLIVTGYEELFSPEVEDWLLTERIGNISQAHLRLFFERIFKDMGQEPDHQVVSRLVRDVLKDAKLKDRRRLGVRAREVAHEHWKAFA
jgi:hypothetical protein